MAETEVIGVTHSASILDIQTQLASAPMHTPEGGCGDGLGVGLGGRPHGKRTAKGAARATLVLMLMAPPEELSTAAQRPMLHAPFGGRCAVFSC
jgi:hypothetical protein